MDERREPYHGKRRRHPTTCIRARTGDGISLSLRKTNSIALQRGDCAMIRILKTAPCRLPLPSLLMMYLCTCGMGAIAPISHDGGQMSPLGLRLGVMGGDAMRVAPYPEAAAI